MNVWEVPGSAASSPSQPSSQGPASPFPALDTATPVPASCLCGRGLSQHLLWHTHTETVCLGLTRRQASPRFETGTISVTDG